MKSLKNIFKHPLTIAIPSFISLFMWLYGQYSLFSIYDKYYQTTPSLGLIILGFTGFSFDAKERDGEANLVASHLLAPQRLIDSSIKLGYTDINKIANLLEVSTMLISYRLREEGYI